MKTPKLITDFMYAVYPDYESLALASFNKEKTLIDATETILELREDNAALMKALKESVECRQCFGTGKMPPLGDCDVCYGSGHLIRHLTPASRALCERLFGGGK